MRPCRSNTLAAAAGNNRGENLRTERPRRCLAWDRGSQRFRRRLARLAHGRLRRAVHRRADGSRPVRQHAGGSLRVDLSRGQGGAPGLGPRDRRSRDQDAARHLRARRQGESATRSTIPHRARAAHRASRPSALRCPQRHRQHAAVSRHRRWAMGRQGDRRKAQ